MQIVSTLSITALHPSIPFNISEGRDPLVDAQEGVHGRVLTHLSEHVKKKTNG